MTLELKLKTIFKYGVFKSYHMPNLISVGVKMRELMRGRGAMCKGHEKAQT